MSDETIRDRNVAAVEAFYEADRHRDIARWAEFWDPNGRHTFHFATATPPVVGLEALVRTSQRKFDVRPPYGIEVQVDAMADPSMVLARLHLSFKAGAPLDLWCLFHFASDGRIVEIEEILDLNREPVFPD